MSRADLITLDSGVFATVRHPNPNLGIVGAKRVRGAAPDETQDWFSFGGIPPFQATPMAINSDLEFADAHQG